MNDNEARMSSVRPRFSPVFLNIACYATLFLQLPMTSPHEMYVSSISTFLNFVILRYQGMEGTPFDTHPKTTTAAILCFLLLVCSIRAEAEAGFRSIRALSARCVSVFWCLTLASVVSLLLPDFIRPFLYVLCFVALILELLQCSSCGRIWGKYKAWFISMINRRRIPRLPV
ncbi:hypothetical protein C2S51_001631 [Perilla frutescens var. frutescens]|nr:hypothetical protein C2S51_001631 [Perilla frutescens var. frutescens]